MDAHLRHLKVHMFIMQQQYTHILDAIHAMHPALCLLKNKLLFQKHDEVIRAFITANDRQTQVLQDMLRMLDSFEQVAEAKGITLSELDVPPDDIDWAGHMPWLTSEAGQFSLDEDVDDDEDCRIYTDFSLYSDDRLYEDDDEDLPFDDDDCPEDMPGTSSLRIHRHFWDEYDDIKSDASAPSEHASELPVTGDALSDREMRSLFGLDEESVGDAPDPWVHLKCLGIYPPAELAARSMMGGDEEQADDDHGSGHDEPGDEVDPDPDYNIPGM